MDQLLIRFVLLLFWLSSWGINSFSVVSWWSITFSCYFQLDMSFLCRRTLCFHFLGFVWPDVGFLVVVVVFFVPVEGVFFEARFSLLPLTPDADDFVAKLSLLPLTPVLLSPVFGPVFGSGDPVFPLTGMRDDPAGLVGDFTDDASEPSWEPVLPIEVWLSVRLGRPVLGSFKLVALPAFLTPVGGLVDFKLVPLLDFTIPPGDRSSPDFSLRTPGTLNCDPVDFLGFVPLGGLAAAERIEPDEPSLESDGLATSEPSRDKPGLLALKASILSLVPDPRSCWRSSRFVLPSAGVNKKKDNVNWHTNQVSKSYSQPPLYYSFGNKNSANLKQQVY